MALERYEDAIQLLIEAYPRLLEEWGSDDKDVQTLVQSIVDVYTALGQPDKEEQYRHLLVPTQPPVASD